MRVVWLSKKKMLKIIYRLVGHTKGFPSINEGKVFISLKYSLKPTNMMLPALFFFKIVLAIL